MKFLSFFWISLLLLSTRLPALEIVAAENFYGGVAREIAGNDAKIISILSNPNQDPHEFTSNAATAKAVADADVVIYNGLGYDEWMEKLLGVSSKKLRVVIKVSGLIGAKDGDNPHIWYSPKTMPALAETLAAVLAKLSPDHAKTCQANLETFRASLQPGLDDIAALKSLTAGMPVTATEPVFGYMAGALGFKMLNYDFQVKVMNDAEPSAAETAAFEKSLTTHAVKILFYNSQVSDPTTARMQDLARQAGVPVVGVTETQPAGKKTYVEWMRGELAEVRAALPLKSR